MKKNLSFLIFILLLAISACEKDEDFDLSKYLIGEWVTPSMQSGYIENPCHYELLIEDTLYCIWRVTDGYTVGWENWPYTFDENNRAITIHAISGEYGTVTFTITLTENKEMMIWTTEDDGGENLIWERGELSVNRMSSNRSNEVEIKTIIEK